MCSELVKLLRKTKSTVEAAPLSAQGEMGTVGKFRATVFSAWEESIPRVLNVYSFLKVKSGVTFSGKPSPHQESPDRLNRTFLFTSRIFMLHGLGLVYWMYSLPSSFRQETWSHPSSRPSMASTKQLLNLLRQIEFSLTT